MSEGKISDLNQSQRAIAFADDLALFDDGDDLSDAQKLALLEVLWRLAVAYAQIGWGMSTTQLAIRVEQSAEMSCGKSPALLPVGGTGAEGMVQYRNQDIAENCQDADASQREES